MSAEGPSAPEPPPFPVTRGWRLPSARWLAFGALVAGGAAATLLFFRSPSEGAGLYPPCVWRAATGTHCPGCGITRALHEALHGRLLAALDFNAVGLLVLLATAAVLVRPGWIAVRQNRWSPPALPRYTSVGLVVVGVLWAILRNLPWPPFTVLAP